MRKRSLWLGMFFAATFIVACAMTLFSVLPFFEDLLNKNIPWSSWAQWIGFGLLDSSSYGIPFGVFAAAVFGIRTWRNEEGRIDLRRVFRIASIGCVIAIASFVLVAEITPRSRARQETLFWTFLMTKPGGTPSPLTSYMSGRSPTSSTFFELERTIDSMKKDEAAHWYEVVALIRENIKPEYLDSLGNDSNLVTIGLSLFDLQPDTLSQGSDQWTLPDIRNFLAMQALTFSNFRLKLEMYKVKRTRMERYPWIVFAAYLVGAGVAFLVHGKARPGAPSN